MVLIKTSFKELRLKFGKTDNIKNNCERVLFIVY